jgi:HD-GYP domain-containing protein (c-di-GMP phosphodiesterase class II)
VWQHHERFDGKGYPKGLKGKEIVIGARIFAIIDTYDAMTSDRPYRKGLPHEVAIEEINKCQGTQFDPDIVEAWNRIPKAHLLALRKRAEEDIKAGT